MAEHAILSASSANRWLHCTPSAVLEAEMPDTESEAAKQGTAAHALAEHKLRRALKQRSRKPRSKYIDDEMEEATDAYVGFVLETLADLEDPLVLVEQHLDYSNLVPDGFGTGDCVIIAEGNLHVIDFKYGQGVLVDSYENPQMMLYALGALNELGMLYDVVDVAMTIYQPRRENVSTYTTTVEELEAWGESIKPTAQIAAEGAGEFVPGPWCGFCKLKSTCRARAEENLSLAQLEFVVAPELTDVEIADVLEKAPGLIKWVKDVQDYALTKAKEGMHWPGFKLVEGRSVRAYKDVDEAAAAAEAAGYADIYDKKLIGITTMERLMGKKTFREVLGDLVIKPAGRPTLAPASDRRPELHLATAADDFKQEEENNG